MPRSARQVVLAAAILGTAHVACVGLEERDDIATSAADGGVVPPTDSTDDDESSGPDEDVSLDLGGATGDPDAPDAPCMQELDIVFVMDVTSSMAPMIDRLAAEISAVDAALQAMELPTAARYGLVVFVDDVELLQDGAAYSDVAALRADFESWSEFTGTDDQIHGGEPNLSWPENSLDALFAATAFDWRPAESTARIVIHTTDDTFWDGPGTHNGVMVAHGYDATVDALQGAGIRVFSFASPLGGECDCDDVAAGWFAPYEGNPSIPTATDGDVFDLDDVVAGDTSLAAALEQAVVDSVCEPYEPVG